MSCFPCLPSDGIELKASSPAASRSTAGSKHNSSSDNATGSGLSLDVSNNNNNTDELNPFEAGDADTELDERIRDLLYFAGAAELHSEHAIAKAVLDYVR